jgi:hypothetical protein
MADRGCSIQRRVNLPSLLCRSQRVRRACSTDGKPGIGEAICCACEVPRCALAAFDARMDGVPASRRAPPDVVRAFVSDLDGTLLRSDGFLSSVSLATVRRIRDVDVPLIVATSRTPRAIQRIAGHEVLGTVVCANGAIVWNAVHDQVLDQTGFDRRS